ncbi:hypothetical protein ACIRPU_12260 [Streptomyces sp. NPDC102259]|uniref:hypothetical protein n=1 Tax=Streptomyces sp. NPDC102259 TaxID=3366148 RepID=UPI003829DA9C
MSALDALVNLCPPPPVKHVRPGYAAGAEPDGGTMVLPSSHAELLEVYGPGCFNDFFWIYDDGCPNTWLDIRARSQKATQILSGKRIPEIRAVLDEFELDPSSMIQWGVTDNADYVFYIPSGVPDEWPTLIVEAGQLSFQLLQQSAPEILLGLLDRTLTCPFFSVEFFETVPTFQRWQEEAEE